MKAMRVAGVEMVASGVVEMAADVDVVTIDGSSPNLSFRRILLLRAMAVVWACMFAQS